MFKREQIRIMVVQHLDITAPTCQITSDVTITGGVTISGNVVANGISLATHTHPGDSGGTTGHRNNGPRDYL